jgi:hypothetical protein
MITMKVVRMPGKTTEVVLEDGATVADALAAAELTLGGNEKMTINGETAVMDDPVFGGDRVILAKDAKSA